MLKRETFVDAIHAIQKQEELTDRLNEVYRELTDGCGSLVLGSITGNALIRTLEDGMDDQYGYIAWWLYEAPDGDKTVIWEENGKEISVELSDVNDLYDYLVQNAEERRGAAT